MEEEQRNQPLPSPRGFRFRFWKIMTLTFLILVGLSVVSFAGIKTTSTSKFCSSCHEMKPEYFTWKASTHSEVECDNCHIAPGGENLVKEKAGLVEEVYRSVTNTYTAPIQMPTEIPNAACEKCHNMSTRTVSPSGDLIIPHDKHLDKQIQCTKCHSSVAHGKISERNVTFQTDYKKWDEELGHSMMSDVNFTKTEMETCMNCHKSRNISLECSTCHTTGMYPDSHKQKTFIMSTHGQLANKEAKECNDCHKYMSNVDITIFQSERASVRYIRHEQKEEKIVTGAEYAKVNNFCKDCHTIRPISHHDSFIHLHGSAAKNNEKRCLTCHEYQTTGFNQVTIVTCAACHPATHEGKAYKISHPVALGSNPVITETCYTCHYKPKCTSCHKE